MYTDDLSRWRITSAGIARSGTAMQIMDRNLCETWCNSKSPQSFATTGVIIQPLDGSARVVDSKRRMVLLEEIFGGDVSIPPYFVTPTAALNSNRTTQQ